MDRNIKQSMALVNTCNYILAPQFNFKIWFYHVTGVINIDSLALKVAVRPIFESVWLNITMFKRVVLANL